MICPHCQKPIASPTGKKSKELEQRVLAFSKQGYTTRDIEALMNREVSYSTAARIIREAKENERDQS